MRLPTGSRCTSKLWQTAMTISSPCRPIRPGSVVSATGSTGSLSHTVTSTRSSVSSRSTIEGPGAYLQAFVSNSLTTSCTRSVARSDTGRPRAARTRARNFRASSRPRAMSPGVPSYSAETLTSSFLSWSPLWAATSIRSALFLSLDRYASASTPKIREHRRKPENSPSDRQNSVVLPLSRPWGAGRGRGSRTRPGRPEAIRRGGRWPSRVLAHCPGRWGGPGPRRPVTRSRTTRSRRAPRGY